MAETTNSGKNQVGEVAEKPFEYRVDEDPVKPQRPPGNAGVWDKRSF